MKHYIIVSLVGLAVLAILVGCAELRETLAEISEIIKDYASVTPTPLPTITPTVTPLPIVTPIVTPTAMPTGTPFPTPTPLIFCRGDELLCIDDFSRVNIAYPYAMDGTVSQDGTFLPTTTGGFVMYGVPINLSQRTTITIIIRGTIPNALLDADTGGKVSLLSWDNDAGDYLLSFQRMYADYRGVQLWTCTNADGQYSLSELINLKQRTHTEIEAMSEWITWNQQRQISIDSNIAYNNFQNIPDWLKTFTISGVDNYVETNVTNLATAKTALKHLGKAIVIMRNYLKLRV